MNTLSSSLKRLSLRLSALQILGNAAMLLAAALWLEIPDSHVWELFLSLLFGAAIVVAFLCLHAIVIRRLRAALDRWPLWLGAVSLAVWIFVVSLPSRLVALVSPATEQRASYWNSQLSPHLRTIFTYERLSHWQFVAYDLVVWFLVPALLLPFVVETVSRGLRSNAWRTGLLVLVQWRYWVTCVVIGFALHFLVLPLVDWQPGHSVTGELVSVVVRLGIVYIAIVLLLTTLLAVTARLLSQCHSTGDTTLQPPQDHAKPVLSDE